MGKYEGSLRSFFDQEEVRLGFCEQHLGDDVADVYMVDTEHPDEGGRSWAVLGKVPLFFLDTVDLKNAEEALGAYVYLFYIWRVNRGDVGPDAQPFRWCTDGKWHELQYDFDFDRSMSNPIAHLQFAVLLPRSRRITNPTLIDRLWHMGYCTWVPHAEKQGELLSLEELSQRPKIRYGLGTRYDKSQPDNG